MSWSYAYTPYIWPLLVVTALVIVLGVSAWRRRHVPAAVPFAALTLIMAVWGLGSALELAAVEPEAKFFWFQFQAILKLPAAVSVLVFILTYASLDKWVTRTTIALLALLCVIVAVLVVTNPAHHLFWPTVSFGPQVSVTYGPAFWAGALLSYLLFFLQVGVLVWLILRSPLYRWPSALILGQQLVVRVAFVSEAVGLNPLAPLDPVILVSSLGAAVYFLALYRFHILDVVPVGRDTAMERMLDGVLILDAENRIVDLNPAAAQLLALARRATIGCPADRALAAYPDLTALLEREGAASAEITLKGPDPLRYFQVHTSPLTHPTGLVLGRLILLQDVTEQKWAQAQLLQQQRRVAVLEERERVARELHDSLSQELAFMNVQAQAAHELLVSGASQAADDYVLRLASVARQAQVDARDLISDLMTSTSPEGGFVPSLRRLLEQFCRKYGVETELRLGDEQVLPALAPTVQAELLRIINEALTNIWKHARARHASLRLDTNADHVEVIIEDDGVGFDPNEPDGDGGRFGLRIMRKRAAAIGGAIEFHSEPGKGTRVVVCVPFMDGGREGEKQRDRERGDGYEGAAGRRSCALS